MEDLIDRIVQFITDLPVGLIIFLVAIAFSFIGGDKRKAADDPDALPRQDESPRPVSPAPGPYGHRDEPTPRSQHTFASDERRAREERERERQQQEVLVFGGLDFGSRDALFRDDEDNDRDSQWGKTKYGFDDAEWGSTFGDRKSSEPIIR